jgi:hypothetical protein
VATALGLALAFTPRSDWLRSVSALVVTTIAVAVSPVPRGCLDYVFLGCWLSIAASAATVHLRGGLSATVAFALSLNSGLWSGAVIALAGSHLDLLKALSCVLVIFPAALSVRLRIPIVVKVVSSWLIAMAVLAATLQFLPVTPGYMPDHLD